MNRTIQQKLEDNHIVFLTNGEICKGTNDIIIKLLNWNRQSKDIKINLYLASGCPSFVHVAAIYDVLMKIENPISVFCIGHVGGFSMMLLAAGTKGERYALKHTSFVLEQPYGSIDSGSRQQTEYEIMAKETTSERKELEEAMAKAFDIPLEKIHEYVENDTEFTAEEAKELGFIDEVLE